MKKIALVLTIALGVVAGCGTPPGVVDKKDPVVKAIMGCTAGALSHYKVSLDFESDINKAIKEKKLNLGSKIEVNDWVKGYIFEKIPQSDALEAYKLYMNCYEKERSREDRVGLDPRLIPLKEETESLWKQWDEALKYGHPLILSDAEKYVLSARKLHQLEDADMDLKNKIMKYERESLMYLLAAELIIRSENKSDFENHKDEAKEYSEKSMQAVQAARKYFQKLVDGKISDRDSDWLIREDVNLVTLDRLAESQAQMVFLGTDNIRSSLNETLNKIPCDYIKKYKFSKNVIYTRITMPQKIVVCGQ